RARRTVAPRTARGLWRRELRHEVRRTWAALLKGCHRSGEQQADCRVNSRSSWLRPRLAFSSPLEKAAKSACAGHSLSGHNAGVGFQGWVAMLGVVPPKDTGRPPAPSLHTDLP